MGNEVLKEMGIRKVHTDGLLIQRFCRDKGIDTEILHGIQMLHLNEVGYRFGIQPVPATEYLERLRSNIQLRVSVLRLASDPSLDKSSRIYFSALIKMVKNTEYGRQVGETYARKDLQTLLNSGSNLS